MFTAGTLAIVFFGNDNGRNPFGLIQFGCTGHRSVRICRTVPHFIRFSVKGIDSPHQHIVRNILQMPAETKPRTCHRDMIGGTLTLRFNQQRHIQQILSVPSRERSKQLQALRLGSHRNIRLCMGRCDIPLAPCRKSFRRQLFAYRFGEFNLFAIGIEQCIFQRIETQISGNGQCHCQFGRGYKGIRIRISIRTLGKVPVERSHNRILTSRIIGHTLPLSDTRAAGICHNCSAYFFKSVNHTVTLCGCTYAFRTRIDNQRSSRMQPLLCYLMRQRHRTAQILVG